jgi:hypothetical protein
VGSGAWSSDAYSKRVMDWGFSSIDSLAASSVNQVYKSYRLDPMLNPLGVIRECCDSEEHPNTIPVIPALDVTGSMGNACTMCAAKLDEIMTKLYSEVQDVQFMMMGIGDLAYDQAPIQATQFESDIRILDQTTKTYFEGGGGGNNFESYTAAWYFGLHNTKLDCWNRGRKGIIITLGDEPLNPYLPKKTLNETLGSTEQADVDTDKLYREVCEKFDVYHIAITNNSSYWRYKDEIKNSWGELLGQRLFVAESDDLPKIVSQIVNDSLSTVGVSSTPSAVITEEGIAW